MTPASEKLFGDALKISPMERAELIELLLTSFERVDRAKIDQEWATEAQARLQAYKSGKLPAKDSKTIFNEINKQN